MGFERGPKGPVGQGFGAEGSSFFSRLRSFGLLMVHIGDSLAPAFLVAVVGLLLVAGARFPWQFLTGPAVRR